MRASPTTRKRWGYRSTPDVLHRAGKNPAVLSSSEPLHICPQARARFVALAGLCEQRLEMKGDYAMQHRVAPPTAPPCAAATRAVWPVRRARRLTAGASEPCSGAAARRKSDGGRA